MYALVKFNDGVLFICKKKNVLRVNRNNECSVKYSNGAVYEGVLLAENENKEELIAQTKLEIDKLNLENQITAQNVTKTNTNIALKHTSKCGMGKKKRINTLRNNYSNILKQVLNFELKCFHLHKGSVSVNINKINITSADKFISVPLSDETKYTALHLPNAGINKHANLKEDIACESANVNQDVNHTDVDKCISVSVSNETESAVLHLPNAGFNKHENLKEDITCESTNFNQDVSHTNVDKLILASFDNDIKDTVLYLFNSRNDNSENEDNLKNIINDNFKEVEAYLSKDFNSLPRIISDQYVNVVTPTWIKSYNSMIDKNESKKLHLNLIEPEQSLVKVIDPVSTTDNGSTLVNTIDSTHFNYVDEILKKVETGNQKGSLKYELINSGTNFSFNLHQFNCKYFFKLDNKENLSTSKDRPLSLNISFDPNSDFEKTFLTLSENERSLLQAIDISVYENNSISFEDLVSAENLRDECIKKLNESKVEDLYGNSKDPGELDKDTSKSANVNNEGDRINVFKTPFNIDNILNNKKEKKHCCYFCNKLYFKIARHIESCHKNEAEVKEISKLPKKNPNRKYLLDQLRKKGNYKYNSSSIINNGDLIVCRLPNKNMKKKPNDYTTCASCKGMYMKSNIRHHFAQCTENYMKGKRTVKILSRMADGKIHVIANERVKRDIIPYMQDSDVKNAIRYDELLILFANNLTEKYSYENHSMIRSKLRLLGRLLIIIKEKCKDISDFCSLYRPKYFSFCYQAVKIIAGYNEETETYTNPSNILHIGKKLKQVGLLLETLYIEREEKEKQIMTKNFIKLIVQNFQIINKKAIEAQTKYKRQKQIRLPTAEEIQKLQSHLEKKRKIACKNLKQHFSFNDCLTLSECCVVELLLFNRRRQGETSKIKLDDFHTYKGIDAQDNPEE
ncbi:GRIP and coiled-coil domain-containing protein-like [Prorops nasuta]|uniref:GRIP and coiled-coil domain-containing protein-like n=1 Tax=Prorops nasuta TaxID=863751 RepID=UPI0034CE37D4